MGKVYTSITQLVGNTPLLELQNISSELGLSARIIAKIEKANPTGSAKDRAALAMIEDAEEKGLLRPGSLIIEPTSGNTGIGLAAMAVAKGYRAMIVMPDSMSVERQLLMKAYGAEVVLTPGNLGMQGAIEKAEQLRRQTPDSFIPAQFENPANPAAHYRSTGPEIWEDTDGKIDFFVAGIGTGGTITGTGRYLKEQNSKIQVIGVEPADSPLLTKGIAGPHGLQGIGANFVPKALDLFVCDKILTVTTEEAYEASRLAGRKEGLLVGISAGAALHAAIALAKQEENAGKTVVVLLPDTGDRYLSTGIFD